MHYRQSDDSGSALVTSRSVLQASDTKETGAHAAAGGCVSANAFATKTGSGSVRRAVAHVVAGRAVLLRHSRDERVLAAQLTHVAHVGVPRLCTHTHPQCEQVSPPHSMIHANLLALPSYSSLRTGVASTQYDTRQLAGIAKLQQSSAHTSFSFKQGEDALLHSNSQHACARTRTRLPATAPSPAELAAPACGARCTWFGRAALAACGKRTCVVDCWWSAQVCSAQAKRHTNCRCAQAAPAQACKKCTCSLSAPLRGPSTSTASPFAAACCASISSASLASCVPENGHHWSSTRTDSQSIAHWF